MSCAIFKVNTDTLDRLVEIGAVKGIPIRTVVENAIESYWIKTCADEVKLVLVDEDTFTVKVKPEHIEYVKELTGKARSHKVEKTYKSIFGLSDGVYKIEDCDTYLPVSWFNKREVLDLKRSVTLLFVISWAITMVQSGALFYLLLL